MENNADPDETRDQTARFSSSIIFSCLLFSLLFIVSCHEKKKEAVIIKPVIDSARIKQSEKARLDSIQKAKEEPPKQHIYLTFDDGPNKGTLNVLKAVEEEKIPASFFIVGKHVYDSPEQQEAWKLLRADSVIELCNHSYTHALNHYTKYYQQPSAVVKDVERNQQVLGFKERIVRMPGRNAWRIDTINHTDIAESRPSIDSVHDAGFNIIGWDVEWFFDNKSLEADPDTELLLRRIRNMLDAEKTRTPGNVVILAHDQSFQRDEDVQRLHYVIQQLKNNPDYELMLVRDYPHIK